MIFRVSSETARHFILQTTATAYVGAVSFALVLFLARELGVSEFGRYQYGLSVAALFGLLQDAGFRTLIFREATSPSPGVTGLLRKLPPFLLFHLALITLFGIWAASLIKDSFLLRLSVACYASFVMGGWLSSALKGRGMFGLESLWQVFSHSITALGAGLAVIWYAPKAEKAFEGLIFSSLIALMVFGGVAIGCRLPRLKWRRLDKKPVSTVRPFPVLFYQMALPLLLIDLFTTIYFRTDVIMLEYWQGPRAAGIYGAVYRLLEGAVFLATPAMHIFFQRLRRVWRQKEKRILFFKKMLLSAVGTGILAAVAGILGRKEIVFWTYGEQFSAGARVLFWFSLTFIFILPNYVLTQTALALNQERFYAIISGLAAGLNIGLNFLLIPAWGIVGAAVSTLCTEVLLAAGLGLKLRRCLEIHSR